MKLIKSTNAPIKKILFLGYSEEQTLLINELTKRHCEVWQTQERIQTTIGYDLVISFGYTHIIKNDVIESSKIPIINLHISYLPWNRGAHPNFWSFYDCTPTGVTIHLMDKGIDTGQILFQKYVNFNNKETTFSETYKRLINEIEQLFLKNINEIIYGRYVARPQKHKGTYHSIAELPREFNGWDSDIKNEIFRLKDILNNQ